VQAIDVWMATCLVFVFGAFIEYSIVNVLARREKLNTIAISKASTTAGGVAHVIQAIPCPGPPVGRGGAYAPSQISKM